MSEIELLHQYKLHAPKILKPFEPFVKECQYRLRVNPYKGCSYQCKFCYIMTEPKIMSRNFTKYLEKDIKVAKLLGLNRFPVMISCSTDPFQPIEEKYQYTKYTLKRLSEEGFNLIILTQNPKYLLKNREYIDIIKKTKVVIEVTIPSINAGPESEGFFKTNAPPAIERLQAMKKIVQEGFPVRLRLVPLIPKLNQKGRISLQTEDDIESLLYEFKMIIEKADDIIKKDMIVISNAMIWSEDIKIKEEYREFYLKYGIEYKHDENFKTWYLNSKLGEELLEIVYRKCQKYNIPFSPCIQRSKFLNSFPCKFPANRINGGEE
jgi:DNA repair photolyase